MKPPRPAPDPLADLLREGRLLGPGHPAYESYRSDIVLTGRPDAVARPASEDETAELLALAQDRGLPVTFAGAQTSLTGSSVAEEGILLATERMDRLLDIGRDPETRGMVARAEPGIRLGEFQRRLEAEGWFYPPDPTSRDEALLGATVATNATGQDTLLYGPTRRWIRELRVVTAAGERRTLRRAAGDRPPEEKATAGYYPARSEIDFLIGSEGTLAAITGVTVDLIPKPPGLFAGLAFFPSLLAAARFAVAARRDERVEPRALELLDRGALDLVGENEEGIRWPAATGAAICFRQEFGDGQERSARLEAWYALLERTLAAQEHPELLDAVLILESPADRERLRSFRHRVPSTLHEKTAALRERGGGKVGTDWWVPYPAAPDFLERWRRRLLEAAIPVIYFGHIGNGHPHVNFLPRDAGEKRRAEELVLVMCAEAVAAGGGVAGEHGLGKTKRALLPLQYGPGRIEEMRSVKRAWDPRWLLGRGNLWEAETR